MTGRGDVLIVVHGPGRGRPVPTGPVFMERLRRMDPALAARLRVYQTGSPKPSLADVSQVLFWLGDPLNEKYPDCYRDAVAIANDARSRGILVLNDPDALNTTSKTSQSAIWRRHGLPCARAQIVSTPEQLIAVVEDMDGPCIVRSDVEHAQRDIPIARDAAEARRIAANMIFPAAVIRLHDIRAEYRAAGVPASSLYTRFHHKARAFVVGGEVMASHLFFSRAPIVGLSNSVFAREARPRRCLARSVGFRRRLFADMIAEDRRYFEDDLLHADTLVRAVRALGLDFAAVDYSIRPDGSVILWEANPYFYLPRGEDSVLSAERDAVRRVNLSLDWMAARLRTDQPERRDRAA